MRDFLIKKLGRERGAEIADLVDERYRSLADKIEGKSKQQEKVLRENTLPRIAMYQILKEENFPQDEIMELMDEHMVVSAAIPMKKNYKFMDSLPCAFFLFKTGFMKIVASSDLWDADIKGDRNEFSVTMKRCFWNDVFKEYGCPEICRFACRCDDITYGDLRHIKYERTQTLGTGGSCCDFKFTKIK